MRIIHRISFNSSPALKKELASLGLEVEEQGLVTFEVDESHPHWLELKVWAEQHRAVDFVTTKFTAREVSTAGWSDLCPTWHHGYPQPDEQYRKLIYELNDWCSQCGIGQRQKAPFRMKKEPKWGKKGILQLNWVFDEFFVKPGVWESVFRPHNIKARTVHNTKGVPLTEVLQLEITNDADIDVSCANLEGTECEQCGQTKYLPFTRGFFPPLVGSSQSRIVRIRQWFGSGYSAFNPILVSKELVADLLAHKVKGVSFWPTHDR